MGHGVTYSSTVQSEHIVALPL